MGMRKVLMTLLAGLLLLGAFYAQSVFAGEKDQTEQVGSPPVYTTFDDLGDKTFGLLIGAPFEELIKSKVGTVKKFEYFNSVADMQLALLDHKIDGYLTSNAVADLQASQDSRVAVFPEAFATSNYGFAFRKKDPAVKDWQAAVDGISDETKASLWKKWTAADDSDKTLPKQDWPGKNGTIIVASCDTIPPMSYGGEDDQLTGFDIEILLMVAKEMDVHLKFEGMDFSALMAYVQAGKARIANGGIIVTDERKKTMDFVEYEPAAFTMVVLADEDAANISFWQGLKESFRRTFPRACCPKTRYTTGTG